MNLPMSTTTDMSLFTLLSGASVPVQIVMVLLLITSLVSWWYIFIKIFTIKRADKDAADFEHAFWTGGDLNQLY
jgi:biopolymer transport protein TolQ